MSMLATSSLAFHCAELGGELWFGRNCLAEEAICNQGQTKPSPCCFSARIVVGSVAKRYKNRKNLFFNPESNLENFSQQSSCTLSGCTLTLDIHLPSKLAHFHQNQNPNGTTISTGVDSAPMHIPAARIPPG